MAENLGDHEPNGEGDTAGNQPPSDAVNNDIAALIAQLRLNESSHRMVDASHGEVQRHVRQVGDGLLDRLSTMDAKSADYIALMLGVLDGEQGQGEASLDDVTEVFGELAGQMQEQDVDRWLRLKQLGNLAHAVQDLAMAQAVRGRVPGDSAEGMGLVRNAHTTIFEKEDDLPQDCRLPLQTLMEELASTVQPPPQQ